MKKNFGFDTKFNKIKVSARNLWMGFERGEGELEIENQGRFDQSRFSQETEAIGQQTPRIGESRSTLRFTHRVSSAGSTLNSDSTPQFFSAPSGSDSSAPSVRVFSEQGNQFPLREEAQVQFRLSNSPEIQATFPLARENEMVGKTFALEPTQSLAQAKLELSKKSTNEQATFRLADHTQKRLASLLAASAKSQSQTSGGNEDPAV